jgi:hypothetical protein
MAGGTDRKDLQRIIEERDYFAFILDAIQGSDDEEDILQEKVLKVMINAKSRIIDCALNDKPFIAAYFCNAPELFSAMNIPWYMLMETAFVLELLSAAHTGGDRQERGDGSRNGPVHRHQVVYLLLRGRAEPASHVHRQPSVPLRRCADDVAGIQEAQGLGTHTQLRCRPALPFG